MAKLLIEKEGLPVGGSSGSSLSGVLMWLKAEAGKNIAGMEGLNIMVLLPDGWVPLW